MNVSSKKLRMVTGGLAFVVLVLFVLVYFHGRSEESAEPEQNADGSDLASATETAAIRVEAAPARMGDLVMRLSATGLTPGAAGDHGFVKSRGTNCVTAG